MQVTIEYVTEILGSHRGDFKEGFLENNALQSAKNLLSFLTNILLRPSLPLNRSKQSTSKIPGWRRKHAQHG
jgi:hypothetical protein